MRVENIGVKFRVEVTVYDNVIGDEIFYLYSVDEVPATFAEHRLDNGKCTKTQLQMFNDEGKWINY